LQNIINLVDYDSYDSLKQSSQQLKQLVHEVQLPDELVKQLNEATRKLKLFHLSVRSSGLKEDSNTQSWAGIFESFVPIKKTEIIHYIKSCWASVFSESALIYRRISKPAQQVCAMAVIVQGRPTTSATWC